MGREATTEIPPVASSTACSSGRVLSEEEERDIGDLFESTRRMTNEGITSLDRVLRRELEDTERLLAAAVEPTGSVLASLSEYVIEVERSMEDVNAWSAVFETKLMNMHRNLAVIKGREDQLEVSTSNRRAVAELVQQLLRELELPIGVEDAIRGSSLDDEKGISELCRGLNRLAEFKARLRDSLPKGVSEMRIVREALQHADEVLDCAFSRVYERFEAITEGWVRWVMQTGNKSEPSTWEAIHGNFANLQNLFADLGKLKQSNAEAFARRYCSRCGEVLMHDLTAAVNAISFEEADSSTVSDAFRAFRAAISSVAQAMDSEGAYVVRTFKLPANLRDRCNREIIVGIDRHLLNLIQRLVDSNSALCVALLAALNDSMTSLRGTLQEYLREPLLRVQDGVEKILSNMSTDFSQQVNAHQAKTHSTWSSGNEYEFPMPELETLRKIISAQSSLGQVSKASQVLSVRTALQLMCNVAFTHIERIAQAATKRNDRIRLQGFFSLATCFGRSEIENEALREPATQLVSLMFAASTSYVTEVVDKHFGKFFTELHNSGFKDSVALSAAGLQGDRREASLSLLKLYKSAVPSSRGVDKTIEACAKTLKKDLIAPELSLQVLRRVECRVVEGLQAFKQLLQGDKVGGSIPIDDVRHSFAHHAKLFEK